MTDGSLQHIDKLYLEGEPKEEVDLTLWKAVEYMIENHPEYARWYRNKQR